MRCSQRPPGVRPWSCPRSGGANARLTSVALLRTGRDFPTMPPAKVLPRLVNRRADVCCRLETPEARDRVLALFDGAAVPLGEHPVDDRPASLQRVQTTGATNARIPDVRAFQSPGWRSGCRRSIRSQGKRRIYNPRDRIRFLMSVNRAPGHFGTAFIQTPVCGRMSRSLNASPLPDRNRRKSAARRP